MEELTGVFLLRSVLLLAGLNAALAQEQTVDVAAGDKLELGPEFSGSISSLLWKHDGNMVAEYVDGKIDDIYGRFQQRTNMDKVTGKLEIANMTAADAGLYTVEINKKDHGSRYRVNVFKMVTKPSVEFKPLSCPSTESCVLSCEGDTEGAEPVDYFWKIGEGAWEKKAKTMSITTADNKHDRTFTCKMKNPVSEEQSKPKDNPFFVEVKPPSNGGKIAAGIIVPLLIILIGVCGALGYKKRDDIRTWLSGNPPVSGAVGVADGNSQGVTLVATGETTKENVAPAAGNGEKSPSANSAVVDETSGLAANPAP